MKEIAPMFKDMNLSQEQAQKLVDFYIAKTQQTFQQPFETYREVRNGWVETAKNHPEIRGNFDRVVSTVAKAIDGVGDPTLAQEFRQVMDMTGAGDHPAFIRMFYRLAQKLTEGQPVTGGGPAPAGQRQQGRPASAAQALYPNLSSGA